MYYYVFMYPVLLKYFYFFYYIKKNKHFKFFILLDMVYNLFEKTFLIKRIMNMSLDKHIKMEVNKFTKNKNKRNLIFKEIIYKLNNKKKIFNYFFKKLLNFITKKMSDTFLSFGNRKQLYKLFTNKYKWIYLKQKKYSDKVNFINVTISFFKKIKELFFHTEAFSDKSDFFLEIFSHLLFETPYDKLIHLYKYEKPNLHHKQDRNKTSYFFNLVSFFFYRIDFFLLQYLYNFSIDKIRYFIQKKYIYVNNYLVQNSNLYLNIYDFIKLSKQIKVLYDNILIISLKLFFDLSNNVSSFFLEIKKKYYIILYKIYHFIKLRMMLYGKRRKKNKKVFYLKLINNKINFRRKKKRILYYYYKYISIDQYSLFKKKKFKSKIYNFVLKRLYSFFNRKQYRNIFNKTYFDYDKFNNQLNFYKKSIKFPFDTTSSYKNYKKNIINSPVINYNELNKLNNFCVIMRPTLMYLLNSTLNLFSLNNYLNLFFYLYNFPIYFHYVYKNKIIVSPKLVDNIWEEKRKLFNFFTTLFNSNKLDNLFMKKNIVI